VVLHDSHGTEFINLAIDALHPRAQVIYGRPVLLYEQFELSVQTHREPPVCAFLIAYHAKSGVPAVLSHIYKWPLLRDVRLNGHPVGEGEVAAALAGSYGIPTTLVTGDDQTCQELREFCPDIETAVVKYSLSRYAGRCLPLEEAQGRIRTAAERAVVNAARHRLPEVSSPVHLEVRFLMEQVARAVGLMPGVQRHGLDWVSYDAPDMPAAYRCLNAMYCLASSGTALPSDYLG
jgi:D-amino peptidase